MSDSPNPKPHMSPVPTQESSPGQIIPPPPQTAQPHSPSVYKQSYFRVIGYGVIRLTYRQWTRLATRFFPEGTPQAQVMERLGFPLPDRLDLSWIDATIAVGGRVRPLDIPKLKKAGITRVVDVRQEHKDDEAALNEAQIELLYLPTPDTYPLSIEDLRKGAQWINEQRKQGERVLIHCEHGVGRSVLLTAAALVCNGYSAHDAFDLIAEKRWQASPNRRQVLRLNDFVKDGACK